MDCPCGSGKTVDECCGPYLKGEAVAPTAEALMRSRYSAFVLHDSDYLLRSWHPKTRPPHLDLSGDETQWLGLEIIATEKGQPGDSVGTVEFRARFQQGMEQGELHEKSRFRYLQERWFYLDGQLDPPRSAPSRNAPCPCGSGKKYKRCCGA